MKIKPVANPNPDVPGTHLKIRDPILRDHLPVEGREVPDNDDFWLRRLRDGDVVLVEAPKEQPQPLAKSSRA